jgi:hypothetical protein
MSSLTPKSSKRENSIYFNQMATKEVLFIEPEIINSKDIEYDVRDESYHYLISTPFDNSLIDNYSKIFI